MDTEIKITLKRTTDEKGRSVLISEYEPEQLKELCLALLTSNEMKETVKMAMVYILAEDDDPKALIQHIRDYAEAIRKEASETRDKDITN